MARKKHKPYGDYRLQPRIVKGDMNQALLKLVQEYQRNSARGMYDDAEIVGTLARRKKISNGHSR